MELEEKSDMKKSVQCNSVCIGNDKGMEQVEHGQSLTQNTEESSQGPYSLYVLFILFLCYLSNQSSRYLISVLTKPMGKDIGYGDVRCVVNNSHAAAVTGINCYRLNSTQCQKDDSFICGWINTGLGMEYELLVGPSFVIIYAISGIPLGTFADYFNRKILLSICVFGWSVSTVLTGAVQEYYQLVILRFILGAFAAGCTPFAASLIRDYFSDKYCGLALGVYSCAIFTGFSLAYAVGNAITIADILGEGWRWAWYICGAFGVLLAVVIVLTIKEPYTSLVLNFGENPKKRRFLSVSEYTSLEKFRLIAKAFLTPSFFILCLAFSLRTGAGYVWSYNMSIYYEEIGQNPQEVATWLSWTPIVGGCAGVVIGGFLSDRFGNKGGIYARVLVIFTSQLCSLPFTFGALLAPPPYCYVANLLNFAIGGAWVGIAFVVIMEIVPVSIHSIDIAFYLFITTIIGGNEPLLVTCFSGWFETTGADEAQSLTNTLLILFPGQYILCAILCLCSLPFLKKDVEKALALDKVMSSVS